MIDNKYAVVLVSDSWRKGSNALSLWSPVMDKERMMPVGDFSGCSQCFDFQCFDCLSVLQYCWLK